ncbi:MAG: outer membrane beta-barrel protein [Gammaproteobacteria bacterium]|nr:outer membrane beta-barrel protein [Gammaproteobacteria bacterium]
MNKTKLIGAMLLMMGVTGSALAQNGFYAGASIGQATIDGCSGVTNCDDEDTGWKIFGGWEMNQNIAFEAAWVDMGEISGSIGASAVSAEADGWTLAVKGILPLNEQFGVFARVGFIDWEIEGGGALSGVDDDGTDLMYGIGAQYMFTDQFGMFGEWEWYDIDDDVDLLSIGVLIKF